MTNQNLTISAKGLDLIKRFEGCHTIIGDKVHSYLDPVGVWTIGWGHTKGVAKGQIISKDQAEVMLREDVKEAEAVVRKYVHVPLTQFQFDALVSFTFNLGVGNLRSSTLLKVLNEGDYDAVPAQLVRWNKGRVRGKLTVLKGLTRRRTAEAALFSMDAPLPSEGGPLLTQKPRAGNVDSKPLAKSRTMWGAAAAAIGTTLQGVATELEPLATAVPYLETVSIALTIAGIAAVAYARIDDHLKQAR